jgi:hypothetical protein
MLVPWYTFYSIVGTAAATLTGLMFVVITLIAQLRARLPSPQSGVRFFNTSNVMHFGAALLVAAILCAPWPSLWEASLLLGLAGLGGMAYLLFMLWEAAHRLRAGYQAAGYQLALSDWLWYTLLPLVSYTALVVAAILLPSFPALVLFVIAAATMLLLFIGIHNAWDLVTYLVIDYPQSQHASQD